MKHGKKYSEAAKLVERGTFYDPADAVALVKKTASAKFDETVELHIRTGCDGRHADQQIRGAVVLPSGTGKEVKVLVFAKGDKLTEAQNAGADFVGGEELIPKIQNEGWFGFDVTTTACLERAQKYFTPFSVRWLLSNNTNDTGVFVGSGFSLTPILVCTRPVLKDQRSVACSIS